MDRVRPRPKNMYGSQNSIKKKVTVPELRARKAANVGESTARLTAQIAPKIAMVTAYDYTMARLADEAGVDMVLVGDSLGMVVQGLSTTIPVTLDEMAYHCRAVARGVAQAHVVGDLPFMSYQVSPAQAVESAGKLMKEGFCESVKLEGGSEIAEHVHRIVRVGIPVVGHIGLTPQSVHAFGGFKVQGRGEQAEKIVSDAIAIAQAGAFAVVVEAVPPDVAEEITTLLSVPTIGIGAGPACDGQVLVCTDMLGLTRGHQPKFTKRFANLGDAAVNAFESFVAEVRTGAFPAAAHTYKPNGAVRPTATLVDELDAPLALNLWH